MGDERRVVQPLKQKAPYETTALPWEPIIRKQWPVAQQYINEVKNVVEIRKPTIDEMKAYFLVLLKTDNDIVEAIRKLL